jgi:integrase
LDKHSIEQTLPIDLMLALGIRKAEVCGLEWKDIDFENRIIRISRNRLYIPKKGVIVSNLKTETSRRDLYIGDFLYEKPTAYRAYYDK